MRKFSRRRFAPTILTIGGTLLLTPGYLFAEGLPQLPEAGILAGSPFAFVDTVGERFGMLFTRKPETKVKKVLAYAGEKVSEVKTLAKTGGKKSALGSAVEAYGNYLSQGEQLVGSIRSKGKDPTPLLEPLAAFAATNISHFSSALEEVEEGEQRIIQEGIRASGERYALALKALADAKPERAVEIGKSVNALFLEEAREAASESRGKHVEQATLNLERLLVPLKDITEEKGEVAEALAQHFEALAISLEDVSGIARTKSLPRTKIHALSKVVTEYHTEALVKLAAKSPSKAVRSSTNTLKVTVEKIQKYLQSGDREATEVAAERYTTYGTLADQLSSTPRGKTTTEEQTAAMQLLASAASQNLDALHSLILNAPEGARSALQESFESTRQWQSSALEALAKQDASSAAFLALGSMDRRTGRAIQDANQVQLEGVKLGITDVQQLLGNLRTVFNVGDGSVAITLGESLVGSIEQLLTLSQSPSLSEDLRGRVEQTLEQAIALQLATIRKVAAGDPARAAEILAQTATILLTKAERGSEDARSTLAQYGRYAALAEDLFALSQGGSILGSDMAERLRIALRGVLPGASEDQLLHAAGGEGGGSDGTGAAGGGSDTGLATTPGSSGILGTILSGPDRAGMRPTSGLKQQTSSQAATTTQENTGTQAQGTTTTSTAAGTQAGGTQAGSTQGGGTQTGEVGQGSTQQGGSTTQSGTGGDGGSGEGSGGGGAATGGGMMGGGGMGGMGGGGMGGMDGGGMMGGGGMGGMGGGGMMGGSGMGGMGGGMTPPSGGAGGTTDSGTTQQGTTEGGSGTTEQQGSTGGSIGGTPQETPPPPPPPPPTNPTMQDFGSPPPPPTTFPSGGSMFPSGGSGFPTGPTGDLRPSPSLYEWLWGSLLRNLIRW